jgi:DNA-binding protein HU-beta
VNKSELIDAIAASADIPKAAAGRALDAVIESVTGALKAGDSLFWLASVLSRSLIVQLAPAVTRRPARRSNRCCQKPGFKAGKGLKEAVN